MLSTAGHSTVGCYLVTFNIRLPPSLTVIPSHMKLSLRKNGDRHGGEGDSSWKVSAKLVSTGAVVGSFSRSDYYAFYRFPRAKQNHITQNLIPILEKSPFPTSYSHIFTRIHCFNCTLAELQHFSDYSTFCEKKVPDRTFVPAWVLTNCSRGADVCLGKWHKFITTVHITSNPSLYGADEDKCASVLNRTLTAVDCPHHVTLFTGPPPAFVVIDNTFSAELPTDEVNRGPCECHLVKKWLPIDPYAQHRIFLDRRGRKNSQFLMGMCLPNCQEKADGSLRCLVSDAHSPNFINCCRPTGQKEILFQSVDGATDMMKRITPLGCSSDACPSDGCFRLPES